MPQRSLSQPALSQRSTPLNYGWMGTLAQFLDLSKSAWMEVLCHSYQQLYRQRSTATQQQAWSDCFEILTAQLAQLAEIRSGSRDWTLIFEYELPREGGRRPDLVMLAAGQILVFEFKQKSSMTAADLDQVAAYARDLRAYHSGSARHPVQAIAVPTRRTQPGEQRQQAYILSPREISTYLTALAEKLPTIDAESWVKAAYAPLPNIVQAARQIFQQEPLPQIKRAQSAGIPAVLERLNQIAATAEAQKQRHLVLITGAPGAGKTLVGLQFVYQIVYQNRLTDGDLKKNLSQPAVFLSGNAPLVAVLQYALKSRVFVQPVRNFYLEHEGRQQKAAREHLIVFDEAQRAWDLPRMSEAYGINSAAPGTVLRIADRSPDWGVLVALIGEGQQIHVGEEEGMEQWNQGLEQTSNWQVHCSPEQGSHFTAVAPLHLHLDALFNLTTSLRSHLAEEVQAWVAHLLSGSFDLAATLMPLLSQAGFDAYLTRDLSLAKAYCRDRYADQPEKRYGLIASSRARNLAAQGIPNDFMSTRRVKMGPWYIDPTESPLSCCALTGVATEFGCQGLELDFPIIGWGDDLRWQDDQWITRSRQRNVRDPLRLRLNSYRVLLTRGRDGFMIFVPPEPKMDGTFEVLRSTGLQLL
ncbi:MAG TPA: DNA/RNA helicase domain-containing protein [Coleofasciculaceae cyanobacterium]